ncbi:hypothetical protein [Paenibacillus sp. EZ-K15]|uniref:hypothetical protein n=1 Tax=Paenibacillus sp. EZ-K15 TaxID=2044275 RepID=UPI000BF623AF|nr:hypothetical protein [Paenibacillus sp. EZ-K15]
MNKQTVVARLFDKLNFDEVKAMLLSKGLLPEKVKRKRDMKNAFFSMASILTEEEVESFVEMAVMKKTKGLPAFTHKLVNLDWYNEKKTEQIKAMFNRINRSYGETYFVSIDVKQVTTANIDMIITIKEYGEFWRTGEKGIESLTAVYNCAIKISLTRKMLTIFAGDDTIHSIIAAYIGSEVKLPIHAYRIENKTSALTWDDQASFKTALFIDFVYNRLKLRGISSSFKEIKFNVDTDIKDVTITGESNNNLINSSLACEYVSLGKDIVQFRTSGSYSRTPFSCFFSLKGRNADILKIVVMDIKDETLRNEVIQMLQEEYIEMCDKGIKDLSATQRQLIQIFQKFAEKDSHKQEVIEQNVLHNVESLTQNIKLFNKADNNIKKFVADIVSYNKVILETMRSDKLESAFAVLDAWLAE